MSRIIGAILVRDNSIISTGFNGPARGYNHCSIECPRKLRGFGEGAGLFLCPAVHAEVNCVANAARIGASTIGSTLYMNSIIPCKDCMSVLVNAGVKEVVVDELRPYSEMSIDIADKVGLRLREFNL